MTSGFNTKVELIDRDLHLLWSARERAMAEDPPDLVTAVRYQQDFDRLLTRRNEVQAEPSV